MKKSGPHDEGVALDRRQLFGHALGGLSALALLRGLSGCAADEAQALPPAAPGGANPTGSPITGGVGGSSAPAVPPAVASPGTPAAAAPSPAAPPVSAMPAPSPAAPAPGMSGAAAPPRAACEVMVTTFPNLADGGPSTSFTRMDQSSRADWAAIGAATRALATKVPDGILNLLRALDKLHVGYPVSVLTHSLQTATRAMMANASDDLVLAALCHDIGMAITVPGHSELSASILRGYVANDAYRVVRHHTEFEWMRGGAPGGMPLDQRARYKAEPWFANASRFIDEWESVSYDPTFTARPLKDFEDLVRSKFGGVVTVNQSTADDCLSPAGGKP